MTTPWRDRIRLVHGDSAGRHLDELGAEDRHDDLVESDLRRADLEYQRRFQPDAALVEELQVRLLGEYAEAGALQFDWGDAMLKPLQETVTAAAKQQVRLELTGLSRGSTIMHVRAVTAASAPQDGMLPIDTSPADAGVRELINLVAKLEEEGDVQAWGELLGPLDTIAKALDRFGLSMGLTWLTATGDVRTASLTGRGLSYAARLRETHQVTESLRISGYITELRSSGSVKVKMGTARNAQAVDVKFETFDQLVAMRFGLGDHVSFIVEQIRNFDAVNRTRSTQYRFVGLDEAAPAAPRLGD